MKTEEHPQPTAVFIQRITAAVSELKDRLQKDYERRYPGLGEIIRIVLDEHQTIRGWCYCMPDGETFHLGGIVADDARVTASLVDASLSLATAGARPARVSRTSSSVTATNSAPSAILGRPRGLG